MPDDGANLMDADPRVDLTNRPGDTIWVWMAPQDVGGTGPFAWLRLAIRARLWQKASPWVRARKDLG